MPTCRNRITIFAPSVPCVGRRGGDVLSLIGLTNDNLTIAGGNDFPIFDSSCPANATATFTACNVGTAGSPITIC